MVFDILIVNDSDSTSHTFQLEHGQHGILVYFITCILLYNLHPTLTPTVDQLQKPSSEGNEIYSK